MTAATPRPELIALLDACKDEPDDDAPRLVLADWLEEYGDESDRDRAEFIRLQIERDGEDDLSPREQALLHDRGPSWLWPIIDVSCGGVLIHRGGVRSGRQARGQQERSGYHDRERKHLSWGAHRVINSACRQRRDPGRRAP